MTSTRKIAFATAALALPLAVAACQETFAATWLHDDAELSDEVALGPPAASGLYLCGFHMLKDDPDVQIETHEYCTTLPNGMRQSVIYDSDGPDARLLGVEYIVSDGVYDELPDVEKKYWHPHSYAVLGGQLLAPRSSRTEEQDVMEELITSWGKAVLVWSDPLESLPYGDPAVMWSVMADGHLDRDLLETRDLRLGISTERIAEERRRVYGLPAPHVGLPRDADAVGRQWTRSGPDDPRHRRVEVAGG